MKFTMIASGSAGNCCVIEENETKLMIDCGGTKVHLHQSLHLLQMHPSDMDALLLTHGHKDHIGQIKMMDMVESYASFAIDKPHHHMLKTTGTLLFKDLKVSVIPLSHDYKDTIGFVVESEKEKLVYITDTGYVHSAHKYLLEGANYYVVESNHDPRMLMSTTRPYFTKQRILSSEGHLCNEDAAITMTSLVNEQTSQIVLAHISREANHAQLALDTMFDTLERARINTAPIDIRAAKQFEILLGGKR